MELSNKTLETIAFAAGYDISDTSAKNYLELMIDSCVQDLLNAGVKQDVIVENNKLLISTIIIYVVDNLNSTPGDFKQSSMYIVNADKLRVSKFKLGDGND